MDTFFSSSATAVVTGAGGGIGAAVAQWLAQRNVQLALIDKDEQALETTVKLCHQLGAHHPLQLAIDLTDSAAVDRGFDEIVRQLGPPTMVAGVAGILVARTLAETTDTDWDNQLAVNATGTFYLLRAASRTMHDSAGGSIVVVGSNAARVPRAQMAAYAASKAAAAALVRTAGLELAARGIRCNVVEPGSTDTAMQRDVWADPVVGEAAAVGGDLSQFRVGIPLGRIADPADVAEVVGFLLSPQSRHVTLQRVLVDGGATL